MPRTSLLVALFIALAPPVLVGCATARPCLDGTISPPAGSQLVFTPYCAKSSDDTCLQAYEWKPRSGPVRGALVIAHGLRDHATRYGALAEALGAQGFAIYAQDMRGHGRSGGDRQRFDSIAQLVEDLDLAVTEAKKRNPGVPVFLYGHSLGGLVSTEYVLAHGDNLKGFILSGPALKLQPSVSGGEKAAARFFSSVLPGLPAQALDDSEFVRDPAAKAELASDPLVDHANLPARSAAAALDAIEDVQRRMEQVTVPFLVMHGSADKATNPEGSRELYARAHSTDKTLKIYDGLYHDLMHEPEHDRIIGEVTAWILARTPASGERSALAPRPRASR